MPIKELLKKLGPLEWVFWLSGFIIIAAALLVNTALVNRVLMFLIGLLLAALVWL